MPSAEFRICARLDSDKCSIFVSSMSCEISRNELRMSHWTSQRVAYCFMSTLMMKQVEYAVSVRINRNPLREGFPARPLGCWCPRSLSCLASLSRYPSLSPSSCSFSFFPRIPFRLSLRCDYLRADAFWAFLLFTSSDRFVASSFLRLVSAAVAVRTLLNI